MGKPNTGDDPTQCAAVNSRLCTINSRVLGAGIV